MEKNTITGLCENIFAFDDCPVPSLQQISQLLQLFELGTLDSPSLFTFSDQNQEQIQEAVKRLIEQENYKEFGKYGCAIVWNTTLTRAMFSVIALDSWTFSPYANRESSAFVATSRGIGSPVIDCGNISLDNNGIRRILRKVDDLLQEAEGRKGEKRSATHGEGMGHQRTPAFIASCVESAISGNEKPPKGGTTDVGMHTGTTCRATAWPLALALFEHQLLASSKEVRHASCQSICWRVVSNIQHHLIEQYILLLEGRRSVCDAQHTRLSIMLKSITKSIEEVQKLTPTTLPQHIADVISQLNVRIKRLFDDRFSSALSRRRLDNLSMEFTPLLLEPPVLIESCSVKDDAKQLLKRSAACSLPVKMYDKDNLRGLLAWLEEYSDVAGKSEPIAMVLLRSTEAILFRYMARIYDLTISEKMVNTLKEIAEKYSDVQSQHSFESLSRSEVRSRKALVHYIVLCYIHQAMCQSYLDISNFGIILDADDLRHFCAFSKDMIDAIEKVAEYLDRYRKGIDERPFHPEGTETLLLWVDSVLPGATFVEPILTLETKYANDREVKRYEEILEKQRKCRLLRASLARLRLSKANLETAMPTVFSFSTESTRAEAKRLRGELHNVDHQIEMESHRLKISQKPPPAIINALPESRGSARRVIFLTRLPALAYLYASFGYTCQLSVTGKYQSANKPSFSWNRHVSTYGDSSLKPSKFDLLQYLSIPSQVGSTNVESIESSKDGVWSPTFQQTSLYPPNGNCPFNVDDRVIVDNLTDRVDDASLQWVVSLDSYNIDSCRSSLPISKLRDMPLYLDKRGFQQLSTIRCAPAQQLRLIKKELFDSTLDWSKEIVRTTFRMALTQIQYLRPMERDPHWRHFECSGGFESINSILTSILEIMQEKERDHRHLILLADIVCFVSDHFSCTRLLARKFACVSLRWADDLAVQLQSANDVSIRKRLHEKRLYGYSILFHEASILESSDIATMIVAICQLHNGFELSKEFKKYGDKMEGDTQLLKDLSILYYRCVDIMSHRAVQIIASVIDDPSPLSKAVGALFGISPPISAWVQYGSTSCFSAIGHNDCLFFVDAIRGTALLDGCPPGTLPHSITSHSLYKRTFGSRNFEVRKNGKKFTTIFPTVGCIYTWELVHSANSEHLIVTEIHPDDLILTLVPNDGIFGKQCPLLVYSLCSFWTNGAGLTFGRDIPFTDRKIHYVMNDSLWIAGSSHELYSFCDIDETMNRMVTVLGSSNSILRQLSKIEKRHFMHVSLNPSNDIEVALPRFKISFVVKSDQVECLGHWRQYKVAKDQVFSSWAVNWRSYILLEEKQTKATALLFVDGHVIRTESGSVKMGVPEEPEASLTLLRADVHHRTGELQPSTMYARLLVAAAAAACRAPLQALRLVRHCFQAEPFSSKERDQMDTILSLTTHPSLKILLVHVRNSGMKFLYSCEVDDDEKVDNLATVYRQTLKQSQFFVDFRSRLTASEEEEIFGERLRVHQSPHISATLELLPYPSSMIPNFVDSMESTITTCLDIITSKVEKDSTNSQFPIAMEPDSALGRELYQDLKDSYAKYIANECPTTIDTTKLIWLREKFEEIREHVSAQRSTLQEYLQNCLLSLPPPEERCPSHLMFLLNRICATDVREQEIPLECLISIACESTIVNDVNPFISFQGCTSLRQHTLKWLELCSLEDKVQNLIRFCKERNTLQLAISVASVRKYEIERYPLWLVFEVLTGLQIRPQQHTIAMMLIENVGSITQLNMGEGKTRVIIPMLVLYFSRMQQERTLTRVFVLSALLAEAKGYFHEVLTASPLNIRIYSIPFHRGLNPSAFQYRIMRQKVIECRQSQGFQLLAPSHVLSLRAKYFDLKERNMRQELRLLLEDIKKSMTIIDEADSVLHYKVQLDYCYGTGIILPSLSARTTMCQALLDSLIVPRTSSLTGFVENKSLFIRNFWFDRAPGHFPEFRMLPLEKASNTSQLCSLLFEHLVCYPPYELHWIKQISSQNLTILRSVVCDATTDAELLSTLSPPLSGQESDAILMLRGLLAHGILAHCLSKRANVQYGLREGKKRLAVPYRACDTPAPRAEFSQPDIAIVYTVLAHYYDGLTSIQVRASICDLLRKGTSFQKNVYKSWVTPLKPCESLSEEDIASINQIEKLNPTNHDQMQVCHRAFSHSMVVINYHLNHAVFERDCFVFPQHTASSAWDLVDSPCVGFSGTNDEHMLLPLQVHQQYADDRLQATNGRMLNLILEKSDPHVRLLARQEGHHMWQSTLLTVVQCKPKCSAVIDVGGVLAGSSLLEMANFVLKMSSHEAVLVFDTENNEWCVVSKDGHCPRSRSPISDAACFAIYDQSRCRGADLKLHPSTVAALLLAQDVCKDMLMQGAGRLRKLHEGQSLVMMISEEEYLSIQKEAGSVDVDVDVTAVLKWAMTNTSKSALSGLPVWAQHGQYYATTNTNPSLRAVDESLELRDMYSAPIVPRTPEGMIRESHESAMKRVEAKPTAKLLAEEHLMMQQILNHAAKYGGDTFAYGGSGESECERELQKEMEQERESQKEFLEQRESLEVMWSFERILNQERAIDIAVYAVLVPLSEYIASKVPAFAAIPWPTNVFCTENFCNGVKSTTGVYEYMRPVDSLLVFNDGSVVLLAHIEADHITQLFSRRRPSSPVLTSLLDLRINREKITVTTALDTATITALKLFAGETMFDGCFSALKLLLQEEKARYVCRKLVRARGNCSAFELSHLDRCLRGILAND